MVDRVVLVALDQAQQVRDLDGQRAVVGEQLAQAAREVDDVGHVREDVVRDHEVGPAVPGGDVGPGLLSQEAHLGGDAALDRRLGDVGGRLDAQAPDAAVTHVLEQVAVVAGHLHDERVGGEPEPSAAVST